MEEDVESCWSVGILPPFAFYETVIFVSLPLIFHYLTWLPAICIQSIHFNPNNNTIHTYLYRGADKSLARPTSVQLFLQSREQVVFRRGQIRRIGWVIKSLKSQIGQFLLGCKFPVIRFLPGRDKDLSAPLYTTRQRILGVGAEHH
jgi:hypothetical protein